MSPPPDPLRALLEDHASAQGLEIEPGDGDILILSDPGRGGRAHLSLDSARRLSQGANKTTIACWARERIQVTALALRRSPALHAGTLLPLLRPPAESGQPHWHQSMADGRLSMLLVRDRGPQLHVLTPMDIVRCGDGLTSLTEHALAALLTRSTGAQLQPHPSLDCLHYTLDDGLTAARGLIIHHLIAAPIGVLLLLPSRGNLWAIPASEPDALMRALTLRSPAARAARESPYPISAEIFWQRRGRLRHLPVTRRSGELRYLSPPPELVGSPES
jgi:hypothetical protein